MSPVTKEFDGVAGFARDSATIYAERRTPMGSNGEALISARKKGDHGGNMVSPVLT